MMSSAPPSAPYQRPLGWVQDPGRRTPTDRVRYTGRLARGGGPLTLHYGYDGWSEPVRDIPLERIDDDSWTAEIETEGHLVVDCIIRDERSGRGDGEEYDNNDDADYRLWIALDPIDAHVHARVPGAEPLGARSLHTAIRSGGMTHALVSWADNDFVDHVCAEAPWLTPLVWVSPTGPSVEDVRARLSGSAAGLKLHPAYDHYPANSPGLDPYLQVAADVGAPVAVHSGPGDADPDLIRQLAERFPTVPIVLYHTFLGLPEGRERASRHAQECANMYLETSWCGSITVEHLIDAVGPDRVLFGSDAATDGALHYVRRPPNLELTENYNQSLLRLAGRLAPDTFRHFVRDNARRLFDLTPEPDPMTDAP